MRQKTIEIAKETMNRDVFICSTGKYYAIMMPLDIYCRYEGMKYRQIEERAAEVARYIVDNNATVRQAAKAFGISKSTIHMVVTK